MLISISLYNQYSLSLLEQSSMKAQQIVELSALNIETYLDDLYRLCLSPYYDQDVIDALDKSIDDSNLISLYRTRTIEDFLEQILIIPRQDILRVFIFTDKVYKGERLPSTIDNTQNYHDFDWYHKVMETREPILVSAHLEQIIKNPKKIVFSIVNVLRSTRNTDKILGVIKVDANYSSIKNICNQPNFGENGGIYIIDTNQQIIFSNMHNFSSKEYIEMYETIEANHNKYKEISIGGNDYIINSAEIKDSNWTMIGVTSFNTINKKILIVRNRAFMIALICFIGSLLIISFYLYMFLHPLSDIISTIKKIQGGNLNVTFPITSKDELGYLAHSLNNMVSELQKMFEENHQLVSEIYEAKYLQKEAQINSLFSQIQPHFIYNTLNMISMLIQSKKYSEAVNNINKLSTMLRGLSNLDKDIRIATEIEFLDAYLSIQKNRYIDRLNYEISIDQSIYDNVIPALTLQPIVENSVIHGCEAKKETTLIRISSDITNDTITLIVEDNGVGMSHENLVALRTKLMNDNDTTIGIKLSEKGNGIALVNVNRRLQIKFGDNYGLVVDSKLNHGTTVRLSIPKHLS